jgi:hypothetical protein
MTIALAVALAVAPSVPISATAPEAPDSAAPTTVTIVRVRTPWYAPQWLVTRRMRGTLPQYRAINGLLFKAYAHGTDRHFGGVYFWRDSASAAAWFNDAWFARVQQQYGEAGDVRRFTVVRGAAHWPARADEHADAVVVLEPGQTGDALPTSAVSNDSPIARYLLHDAQGRPALLTMWGRAAEATRYIASRPNVSPGKTTEWFDCPILLPVAQITAP